MHHTKILGGENKYSKVGQKKIEKYLRALAIIRSNQSRLIY